MPAIRGRPVPFPNWRERPCNGLRESIQAAIHPRALSVTPVRCACGASFARCLRPHIAVWGSASDDIVMWRRLCRLNDIAHGARLQIDDAGYREPLLNGYSRPSARSC